MLESLPACYVEFDNEYRHFQECREILDFLRKSVALRLNLKGVISKKMYLGVASFVWSMRQILFKPRLRSAYENTVEV